MPYTIPFLFAVDSSKCLTPLKLKFLIIGNSKLCRFVIKILFSTPVLLSLDRDHNEQESGGGGVQVHEASDWSFQTNI